MRIAILGAGFSGLAAAYELNKAGYNVTIFEKNKLPGGAAGGFKRENWQWHLDYAYHHWFTNDYDMLNLCKKIGFTKIIIRRPETASLYEKMNNEFSKKNNLFEKLFGNHTQIYKLDSPLNLLTFDRLSLLNRLRTGIVLAALKYGPKIPLYDKLSAYQFLRSTMGKMSSRTLWEPLFNKKFANFASKISTSFFWARIKKRTPALFYPQGGFQALSNYVAEYLVKKGVTIHYNTEVTTIKKSTNHTFEILLNEASPVNTRDISQAVERNPSEVPIAKTIGTKGDKNNVRKFNIVINTLPSPIFLKLEQKLLPHAYRTRLARIKYLGAQTYIIETRRPVIPQIYWLNITPSNNPWMVAVQHTNFMDKKYFNNHHLLYLATYTNKKLPLPQLPKREIVWSKEYFIPYAQPLYTTDFHTYMPHATTPITGLYFANMELTYPYDRGTNYAVKVGLDAARAVIKSAGERT